VKPIVSSTTGVDVKGTPDIEGVEGIVLKGFVDEEAG
jgi:hypothetical protein